VTNPTPILVAALQKIKQFLGCVVAHPKQLNLKFL
jgi:hypothetical protein